MWQSQVEKEFRIVVSITIGEQMPPGTSNFPLQSWNFTLPHTEVLIVGTGLNLNFELISTLRSFYHYYCHVIS